MEIRRGKTEQQLQATVNKYDGDGNQLWRIFPCYVNWNQESNTLKNKITANFGYDFQQKTK